jgi:DNA helicase INO80
VRARAEAAADAALAATAAFDAAVPGGAPVAAPAPAAEVAQPVMFGGTLKGYQLKGLQWLVNVYEQGLNCILADEMARTPACMLCVCLC